MDKGTLSPAKYWVSTGRHENVDYDVKHQPHELEVTSIA